MPGPIVLSGSIVIYPELQKRLNIAEIDQAQKIWKVLTTPHWLKQSAGFEQGLTLAAVDNRMLLVAFTGETWCPHCIALKTEVFETYTFGHWQFSKGLVLVRVDFPPVLDEASADAALQQKYQVHQTYPTVIGMNADGSERGRVIGYGTGSGPTDWIQKFEAATNMYTASYAPLRHAKAAGK